MNFHHTTKGHLSDCKKYLIAPYAFSESITHALYTHHEESKSMARLLGMGTFDEMVTEAERRAKK